MTKGVVVVTGGSRGIGAEVVVEAARAGNDVVFGYHNKDKRANAVVGRVEELGRTAVAVKGDITEHDVQEELLQTARQLAAERDTESRALVLNVAGGLESAGPEVTADEMEEAAYLINSVVPWQLASNFLIQERSHGNIGVKKDIVYVTSNPSHFYGHPENTMPSSVYDVVAASKHEGEESLRDEISDGGFQVDSRMLVATADLVDGTAGATLLRMEHRRETGDRQADLLDLRSAQLEALIGRGVPDASEFGGAIVSMFMDDELPSGHTLYLPKPVLGEYIVPSDEFPFGAHDPAMHTIIS